MPGCGSYAPGPVAARGGFCIAGSARPSSSRPSGRRPSATTAGSIRPRSGPEPGWTSWRRTDMPKMSELRSAASVHDVVLGDPEVRAEYDRTALAQQVATRGIRYRVEHELSQSALARQLGMQQPAIARLEAGDHEPSLTMLARLARGLGIEFHIDVTPATLGLRETACSPRRDRLRYHPPRWEWSRSDSFRPERNAMRRSMKTP